MYIDAGEEIKKSDGGLLRLHSTYRHDLRCYTSDEGRCQKTAAAFLKGMLTLEGALAPILAIMVVNDEKAVEMLDDNSSAGPLLNQMKANLDDLLHYKQKDLCAYFVEKYKEVPPAVMLELFEEIQCPYE